ncbi:uncharacterized protein LOC123290595 [Chrysoperla carnea]|uniref:uncharacterized protein LOC123290595 n=1 Tax=Chrysoperla carnea TaxID=189513 RepID=UPI001D07BE44|nr:uncharacterized protein LOC123290595 [Chrysoperla carnea]
MRHQEKHGKNETIECKRKLVSDMKGIVDTIKNELSTMEIDVDDKKKSRPPRIPDLSIDDKRKILGLVNMLGKMNQDKDKYCEQVANYCNEIKSFQSEISRIKEMHQYEKLNFCTQIEELNDTIKTLKEKQDKEFDEFTLYKTQKENEIAKLRAEHIQEIQNVRNDYQNKFDSQKTSHDIEMDQLRTQIIEQQNLLQAKAIDHATIENSSKLIIEQLQKENSSLQTRVDVCRTKLKSAFYALKKIKRKLERKPTVCSRSVQTMNTYTNEDLTTKIKWDNKPTDRTPKLTDQALISELFFNKEKSQLPLDPLFYSNNLKVMSKDFARVE